MKIIEYSFEWDFQSNSGQVHLKNDQGQKKDVSVDSLEEFAAMSYILKNSNKVFYENDKLAMEWTPIGS